MDTPRHRDRSDLHTLPVSFRDLVTGDVSSAVEVETLSRWESFDDDFDTGRVPGRYPSRPCLHKKVTIDLLDSVPRRVPSSINHIFEYVTPYPLPFGEERCVLLCDELLASVPDLPRTVHRLQTQAMTQIPPTVDLGTFLVEYKDSLELIPGLFDSAAKWARMRPSVGGLERGAASNHLALQFGFLPLVSDLEGFASFSSDLIARIEKLKKWNGKTHRHRSKATWVVEPPALYDDWLGWAPAQKYGLFIDHGPIYVEVGVSALLHCNLEGLGDWTGITAAALAQSGLNNPIAVAWELIPFSFVVDWVTNVGDRLKRVGATPISGEWRLTDWCWTAHLKRRSTIKWWGYEPLDSEWPGWSYENQISEGLAAYVYQDVFIRDTEFPGLTIGLPLTAGQAGLALALLIQSMS